jgi:predicted alpha/beta superfamily hydrolase
MPWQQYTVYRQAQGQPHTVVGDVQLWLGLESPQLGNSRDILVYLPPSYWARQARRYPVIYMHDGQNLFDLATSFAGEWRVDETMEALAKESVEAIVVGVPNAGDERRHEYSPFRDRRLGGGKGDAYLRFLLDTVKPLVDRSFRSDQSRAATGLMGSSMGGLISLYGFFALPHAFGFAGVMSPALWFGRGQIMRYVAKQPPILGRIYLDMGTAEGAEPVKMEPWRRRLLARSTTLDGELYAMLTAKGYRPGRDIRYVVDEGAPHNEAAWAARLPAALRFLLAER